MLQREEYLNRVVWCTHNNNNNPSPPPPAGTIEVVLDTDEGTLSFRDLESSYDSYGVAFRDLKGLCLRPAFSLYSADTSVSILAGACTRVLLVCTCVDGGY